MTRALWPVGEAAQADYEQLRTSSLAGTPAVGLAATLFERHGLWGLIASPQAEPVYVASILGAARKAWSPHSDPRALALADGFQIIVAASVVTLTQEKTG